MTFEVWIKHVESLITFAIDAAEWRKYYDARLTPQQAIEQHRVDDEV